MNKKKFDMFLYLKLAGGFEQKSSRLIEAHVRIVLFNIYLDFLNIRKRAHYLCTLLYCGTLLDNLCTLLLSGITLHFLERGGGVNDSKLKIKCVMK